MKELISRCYTEWIMSRAERVFFVYGMRRSGNNACIGWLTNALEGEAVTLIESNRINNFNYSDSGRTFFVNDVSTMDGRRYLKSLARDRNKIRQARFIIISAEDKDASVGRGWRIPRRSEMILARRDTLNLMASRFQNLNRRAQEGLGASLQTMQGKFFETLKGHIKNPQGAVWRFERWCNDEVWRREFLAQLGLNHDISPHMVGLGSSFGNRQAQPSSSQLSERFATVEPRAPWIAFIRHAASEFPDVFSAEEHASVRALVD